MTEVLLMNIGIGITCFIIGVVCYYVYHWNIERYQRSRNNDLFDTVTYYNGFPLEERLQS